MKLTNTMKDRIIANILADTFDAREAAIRAQYTQLADAIYTSFYGPHAKKMSALPESFFLSKSSFDIRIEGDRFAKSLSMSTTRLFGKCHDYTALNIGAENAFAIEYRAIEEKASVFNSDKASLKTTLNSVILPITTDKRLVEVWPDAEKWIPRTPAAMSNLPAVRSEDLNALIRNMKEAAA